MNILKGLRQSARGCDVGATLGSRPAPCTSPSLKWRGRYPISFEHFGRCNALERIGHVIPNAVLRSVEHPHHERYRVRCSIAHHTKSGKQGAAQRNWRPAILETVHKHINYSSGIWSIQTQSVSHITTQIERARLVRKRANHGRQSIGTNFDQGMNSAARHYAGSRTHQAGQFRDCIACRGTKDFESADCVLSIIVSFITPHFGSVPHTLRLQPPGHPNNLPRHSGVSAFIHFINCGSAFVPMCRIATSASWLLECAAASAGYREKYALGMYAC